jgi:hypothetical protein
MFPAQFDSCYADCRLFDMADDIILPLFAGFQAHHADSLCALMNA